MHSTWEVAMASSRRSTLAVIEVTRMRPEAPDYQDFSAALVQNAVDRAIGTGWDVVRTPADIGPAALLDAVGGADGVLIMGGEDIAPEHYGVRRGYPNEGIHRPLADEAQLAVIRRAAQTRTPLLGICRGHQLINVAFGGTLITDLGEQHEHRNEDVPIQRVLNPHAVDIAAEPGYLAGLGDRITVESAHHQAVERLGLGLGAIAWAPDGVIEAVAHRELPITGVQWHPEAPRANAEHFDALLLGLQAQLVAPDVVRVA
ncbi:gamma-glutamyl-gamma-aminobutyrate hydrolase family protein [Mycetocola reblochoni]|nr:gamma-glutamyl-gamma-aminobutyrate hydrolase family protein [Mycetocola reblochoni]